MLMRPAMDRGWTNYDFMSQQRQTSQPQTKTDKQVLGGESMESLTHLKEGHNDKQPKSQNYGILTGQRHDGSLSQTKSILKSFKLSTQPFNSNLTVSQRAGHEETPEYYAVMSRLGPGRPDIVLHSGKDKHGDQLAVAYFRFSRHIRMGFGCESLGASDELWEDMKNTSAYLGHARYEFEYNVPADGLAFIHDIPHTSGRTRTRFVWERTREANDGVKGFVEQHLGWRNYRLTEESTGQTLAVMLVDMCTGVWYKGELNLYKTLPREVEIAIVLTAACIMEKGERRVGRYTFGPVNGPAPNV